MMLAGSETYLELQRRFLGALERRLADMTALLADGADAEGLMRMFHSLAGIGGTYGFARVTEISGRCEAMCDEAIRQKRVLTGAEKESLHGAVAAIRAATASPA